MVSSIILLTQPFWDLSRSRYVVCNAQARSNPPHERTSMGLSALLEGLLPRTAQEYGGTLPPESRVPLMREQVVVQQSD